MKRSLVVFGLTILGVCSLDAAQFLTQAEIRARLDELYMPLSDGSICWAYRHVDRCYNTCGPFKPYEYRCPTCGESTWYREKILIGTGIDIAEYLTWARKAVEELRAMRLDVRMDERVLCATCRCELKIPDGGEIVRIPEFWPARSGRCDVFPYSVGEKVDIVNEPYRNLFGVARPGQTYWVRAKELAEAIKRKDNRLMDVYMGSDEKYTKYGGGRYLLGIQLPYAGGRDQWLGALSAARFAIASNLFFDPQRCSWQSDLRRGENAADRHLHADVGD